MSYKNQPKITLLIFLVYCYICVLLVNGGKCDQQVLFNSENVQSTTNKSINSNHGSNLIKYGFSGKFWDYIGSNQHLSVNSLSPKCSAILDQYSKLIDQGDQKALKLLSSSSHLPAKFFEVSYSDLEGYDSCLSMADDQVHYCVASVWPLDKKNYPHWFTLEYNTTIHIGFCLPSSCSESEIDSLITSVMDTNDWEKVHFHGCQVPSTFSQRFVKANRYQQASLLFLITIIGIVTISTIISHFNMPYNCSWLKHFALQETHRNLINSRRKDRIDTLDKFRLLIAFLYMCVHSFALIAMSKLIYLAEGLHTITLHARRWTYQPINSDWIFGGLIYVGGATNALHLWITIKPDSPLKTYINLFLKRLFLYWPVLIVTIAMKIVLPLLGSGPIYSTHTEWRSEVCRKGFWHTLFHIQNYQSTFDMCNPPFWSLDAELHLYVLALILVYLYKTRPQIGLIVNISAVFIGLGFIVHIFYSNNLVYRLAGTTIESFDQIEKLIHLTYNRTEGNIFTYAFSLMVAFRLLQNPNINISKKTEKMVSTILITLLIIQVYSPGIWNVMRIEGNNFWYTIHALVCKIISTLSFAWIPILIRATIAKFIKNETMANRDEKLDDNYNTIDEAAKKIGHKNSELHSTAFKLFYAASRASYFVHYPVFVWYYSSKTKLYFDLRFIGDSMWLVGLGYLSGLVFHYLIIGPFENIIGSFKLKKFGKFE